MWRCKIEKGYSFKSKLIFFLGIILLWLRKETYSQQIIMILDLTTIKFKEVII